MNRIFLYNDVLSLLPCPLNLKCLHAGTKCIPIQPDKVPFIRDIDLTQWNVNCTHEKRNVILNIVYILQ